MDAVGGLDESLINSMEYEYFLRLARIGRFAYLEAALLLYRLSDDQISSPRHAVDMQRCVLQIVERLAASDPELVSRHIKSYRRRLGSCHQELALALAESDRPVALRHLLESLKLGRINAVTLRTLARLALPATAREAIRRLRRTAPPS
jgi:hypothetical protein